MGKWLNLAGALAAASCGFMGPAVAQTSNALPGARTIFDTISAGEVGTMMAEFGVATQLVAIPGVDVPVLLATTEGGGRFIFYFQGCDDPKTVARCAAVVVSTGLPAGGATYETLNDFNSSAAITTAVNVPGEKVVVLGRNILVAGGHSRELFQATVVLFLVDVSNFSKANAGVASVAFARPAEAGSKISARTDAPATAGAFGIADYSQLVAAAIDNTNDVDFLVSNPNAN